MTKRNLILSIRSGDFLPQLTSAAARSETSGSDRSVVQIYQPAPERRVLLRNDATQSPKRRLRDGERQRIFSGRLSTPRDQPQSRKLARFDARASSWTSSRTLPQPRV